MSCDDIMSRADMVFRNKRILSLNSNLGKICLETYSPLPIHFICSYENEKIICSSTRPKLFACKYWISMKFCTRKGKDL